MPKPEPRHSIRCLGGPSGLTVTPTEIRVLEALLRRTMPQTTTRSDTATTHRALQRTFDRWLHSYGSKSPANLLESDAVSNP